MPKRGPHRTSPIKRRVGERIRELREQQALSQAELGRRAGTSTSQVHSIERGDRAANVVSLDHLARALGVPVATFFEEPASTRKPSRSETIWFRLMDRLRDADVEYLRAVERFVKLLDEALERLPRGAK